MITRFFDKEEVMYPSRKKFVVLDGPIKTGSVEDAALMIGTVVVGVLLSMFREYLWFLKI